MVPRTDVLTRPLTERACTLWVEHPDRFRAGDVVKSMETGEMLKVVEVRPDRVMVERAVGAIRRLPAPAGSVVLVVAGTR